MLFFFFFSILHPGLKFRIQASSNSLHLFVFVAVRLHVKPAYLFKSSLHLTLIKILKNDYKLRVTAETFMVEERNEDKLLNEGINYILATYGAKYAKT